ncbi:MAG: ribosomal protein S18-alanine N-acetyltransferase [Thiohalophilus sp.]|uniref:ribosomal protein S18-alanine N-acetyltransferase n=1 Tax=Thiohalophilus sp. TaxID=3028392 RepID=UPI002870398E|nr:ribosomal protein S18-alanine N-acetyltransferase [Thiohalophilus sp.]MDR9436334.1 ribosomal protein S18-alanine N-acetyltransferase [Thiohalophilus sp.]
MSAVFKQADDGIRAMTPTDLDEVMAIEEAIYNFPWTRGIFRDCLAVGYPCRVLQIEGRLQAYAILSIAAGEAHILTLCVNPESHRRGYGELLLGDIVQLARERRVDSVYLEVRPSNQAAIRLYEKTGFQEIGIRPDYYPDEFGREDALVMALSLGD